MMNKRGGLWMSMWRPRYTRRTLGDRCSREPIRHTLTAAFASGILEQMWPLACGFNYTNEAHRFQLNPVATHATQ